MKRLYQLLSILMVIFIFTNSTLSADVSANQSGFFSNLALSILNTIGIHMNPLTLSFLIRKLAHFTEFFVLGYLVIKGFDVKLIVAILLMFLIGTLDESIQLFSAGRAFSLVDITIDGIGGITGILVSKFLVKTNQNRTHLV